MSFIDCVRYTIIGGLVRTVHYFLYFKRQWFNTKYLKNMLVFVPTPKMILIRGGHSIVKVNNHVRILYM